MTGTGLVMPVDYYPNRCQEELEAMLTAVQERQTKGAVFFTTGTGIQSQRPFQGSSRAEVEIRRILYSLHLKMPEERKRPRSAVCAPPFASCHADFGRFGNLRYSRLGSLRYVRVSSRF